MKKVVVVKKKTMPKKVMSASKVAKMARAGKDLGKPGKNFAKVAEAGEQEYGSKAAGKKVAGAVLNKMRKAGKL